MNVEIGLDYGLRDEGPFTVETDRLLLRDVRDEDVDTLLAHYTDESAQPHILTRQKDREHIRRSVAASVDTLPILRRGHFMLAIEVKNSGELAGTCTLSHALLGGSFALLGWHISHAHSNNGYATESGAAVLGFAFEQRKIGKVIADCFAHNAAVQRVLLKLGMRPEPLSWFGRRRLRKAYGERHPIVRYGIESDAPSRVGAK
jgi:ribosomal-protein-alanine N-acetyltransferase